MPSKSDRDEQGYFDLQVNGYAGVDFKQDNLTAGDLQKACERLQADGTEIFLATVFTDSIETMANSLANLARRREEVPLAKRMIAGFHIEGPFLNPEPGYCGAHDAGAIRPANTDQMKRLLDAGGGLTRLVTLAPEYDEGFRVTKMLSGMGIKVSAGHCNPNLDTLNAAIDCGLSLFTHLGNGCPMQLHRHDNIIQRALSLSDRLWLCFIADGAHIPFPALTNYLRASGLERTVVVTDAVGPAGLGPGRYTFGRFGEIDVGENLTALAPDGTHLLGSVVTMPQAVKNLTSHCRVSRAEAMRLTCENPRRAMGMPPS